MDMRVNPLQVEVLRWIVDGCPDGVMKDFTYKTVTYALRARGLATVSKKGGVWAAAATEAGLYYLEHGTYPEPVQAKRPAPKVTLKPAAKTKPPADVVTRVSAPSAAHSQVAKIPPAPVAPKPPLPRVDVPDQLRHPHPVVVALKDSRRGFVITAPARQRALRIVQGLIAAAEREGYVARTTAESRDRSGRAWQSNDDFVIDTGERSVGIRVRQESDRSAHVPTPREIADKKRYEWNHIPEYDHTPSERLRIEVGGWSHGRQSNWSDRKSWTLEEKLPAVLHELKMQHDEAIADRLENERKEAERQAQWQVAVDKAKVRLVESHRGKELVRQAESWQRAGLLREYIGAMETAVTAEPDPEFRASGREWIEWATRHAESLDPLAKPVAMPDDPEPTDEALAPFLPRRDRYGYGW